tara:strand:- start:433 stop:615 length:183 start_codon:yes stop_codon:yes gene_type:complete
MELILTVPPIPAKMLELHNRIIDEDNKDKGVMLKKSIRNRCLKTGSKHFDKETMNKILID